MRILGSLQTPKNFFKILKKVLAFSEEVCYYIEVAGNGTQKLKKSGCGEVWYRA